MHRAGLISYGEMVAVGRAIHEATQALPIIGDGDTGYGNALNVKRTVRGYAGAGFAGVPPSLVAGTCIKHLQHIDRRAQTLLQSEIQKASFKASVWAWAGLLALRQWDLLCTCLGRASPHIGDCAMVAQSLMSI